MRNFNDSSQVAACLNYNTFHKEKLLANSPLLLRKNQPKPDIKLKKRTMSSNNEAKSYKSAKPSDYSRTLAARSSSSTIENDSSCKCSSCLRSTLNENYQSIQSGKSKKASERVNARNSLTKFMQNLRNATDTNLNPLSLKSKNEPPRENVKIEPKKAVSKKTPQRKKTSLLTNEIVEKSHTEQENYDADTNFNNQTDVKLAKNFGGLSLHSLNSSSLFSYRKDPAYAEIFRTSGQASSAQSQIPLEQGKLSIETEQKPNAMKSTILTKSNKSCQTDMPFTPNQQQQQLSAFIVTSEKGQIGYRSKGASSRNTCKHINLVCEDCARSLKDRYGNDLKVMDSYLVGSF
jgi:hypothetical protein